MSEGTARRLLVTGTLAVALGLAAAASTAAPPRLAAVRSWAFAIGSGNLAGDIRARYAPFDLVVVDGEEATTAQVGALRAHGTIVLAYLDVGTIEPGRSWFPRAKPYRLDYWQDWGEWYANVDARPYRTLIAGSVAPALLAKGFDGLFLDNVDMTETHAGQAPGMLALVRSLARLVHAHGRYLFSQNGEAVIGPTLPYLDGWNREDVSGTFDFAAKRYVAVSRSDSVAALAALRRLRARGLLTLATDYVSRGNEAATKRAIAAACAAGALPFVTNIDLTRIPRAAQRC